MTDRKFEAVSAKDPTDVYHRVRIRCSHAGCENSMIFSRRGLINPTQAANWFRDKNWSVSGHQGSDLCPEHNGTAPKRADGGANLKVVHSDIRASDHMENPFPKEMELAPKILRKISETPPEVEHMGVVAVPVITKTDKRIIYAKLDEVYADERTGYRGNWSDERVATDLGVPKEWVALCRDETFGPEINKQIEIDKLVAEAEHQVALFRAAIDTLMHDVKVTIDGYENKLKELKA